jgi:hypothetical protein
MMYPFRCPSCGSPTAGTLRTAPDVPYYLCGWYATSRAECAMRPRPDPGNLEALTKGETRELLDMVDFTELALIRSAR